MHQKNKSVLGPGSTSSYNFSHPCLGLYLQGGVKSLAIMELGIQISMIIILSFGMPGHIKTMISSVDSDEREKLGESVTRDDWIKFWMRPAVLGYYYVYIFCNLFLTRFLYAAASMRDSYKLMKWLVPSFILYLGWILALTSQSVYIGLVHITGAATWWSFTVYKLYSFWVVYSFVKEIRHYAGINFVLRKLTDEEIDEFLKGCPANPKDKCGGEDYEDFADKPHKREIEIDINRLIFDDKAPPLGSGAFGTVVKANLLVDTSTHTPPEYKPVAVKKVCATAHVLYFRALLSELKILSYIGRHENIVNLVGACTSGLGDSQLFVVVEFCPYGSMANYLQANRGRFSDMLPSVTTTSIDVQWQINKVNYIPQDAVVTVCDDSPTTLDLIKWSMQTARGMEFISSRNVIHGDLAARNVLLTKERNIKIADFGLSHQLYNYQYFTQDADQPLPWRSMAPEALKSLKLSTRCDIWSYGVTLWEYFTLGATPYECWKKYSPSFVDGLISSGIRLEKPSYATDEIYRKMLECWETDAAKRPTFSHIAEYFRNLEISLVKSIK